MIVRKPLLGLAPNLITDNAAYMSMAKRWGSDLEPIMAAIDGARGRAKHGALVTTSPVAFNAATRCYGRDVRAGANSDAQLVAKYIEALGFVGVTPAIHFGVGGSVTFRFSFQKPC